jgi:hypothetical protein
LVGTDLSPADIAAVSGNNRNNGFMGDNWVWLIVLFLFCGWGNNGWGNRGNNGAMDNYVLASDFATLQRQIDSSTQSLERKSDAINNGICDSAYAMNTTMLNGFAGVNHNMSNGFMNAELARCNQQAALMQQLNNMQAQNAECCCNIKQAIGETNYNIATQACDTRNTIQNATRDIVDNQNCNARAILDALTAQRIEAKDAKIAEQNQQIFAAQLAASQAAQNAYLVNQLKPCPIPAYLVQNPSCCYGTVTTACGCGIAA